MHPLTMTTMLQLNMLKLVLGRCFVYIRKLHARKPVSSRYELLQNERLLLMQKHEMESTSNRQNFESQLGAKTSVITTLQVKEGGESE